MVLRHEKRDDYIGVHNPRQPTQKLSTKFPIIQERFAATYPTAVNDAGQRKKSTQVTVIDFGLPSKNTLGNIISKCPFCNGNTLAGLPSLPIMRRSIHSGLLSSRPAFSLASFHCRTFDLAS